MGLIPSINGDAMKLAERAVTALERIAAAMETKTEEPVSRQAYTSPFSGPRFTDGDDVVGPRF